MCFQILLIQGKSVNIAGTEPRKFYLFLHGSHVYVALDSISEKSQPQFPSLNLQNSKLRNHQIQYTTHIIHAQAD